MLITGGNGLGKTSLLEAIVYLLANYRVHRPPTGEDLEPAQLAHKGRGYWRLRSRGHDDAGQPIEAAVGWSNDPNEDPGARDDPWWKRVQADLSRASDPIPPDLLASTMSFFQEEARSVLDDAARSRSIVSWFRARSPAVIGLEAAVADELVKQRRARDTNEGERKGLREAPAELASLGVRLRALVVAQIDQLRAAAALDEASGTAVRKLLADAFPEESARDIEAVGVLGQLLGDLAGVESGAPTRGTRGVWGLRRAVRALRRLAPGGDVDTRALQAELDRIDRRLRAFDPEAAAALLAEARAAAEEDPPLHRVIASLSANLARWKRLSEDVVCAGRGRR